MDAQLKQKWIEALRSGDYQQTKGILRQNGCHCCLGVLAEIAGMNITNGGGIEENGVYQGYNPLERVLRGFKFTELARRNDEGFSFPKIADYIEANIPADEASA